MSTELIKKILSQNLVISAYQRSKALMLETVSGGQPPKPMRPPPPKDRKRPAPDDTRQWVNLTPAPVNLEKKRA